MDLNYKGLQGENYALREYILRLQARLLDTQGDYPQPPPGVNLAHPNAQAQPQHGGPEVLQTAGAVAPSANPLEVAAQAVAGLSRSSYAPRTDEDARTAEEITRQLQAEGVPDGLPTAPM